MSQRKQSRGNNMSVHCPTYIAPHTHTMGTANKNGARQAVKDNSSRAAGQPRTSSGVLIENDKVQSWTVGSV